ncbi:MAG: type II secretion system protein [Rubrivivax sp.]
MKRAAPKAPPPTRQVATQAGFSLLEVLVTVVIFALLFSVLMAGWFQSLQAQQRLTAAADQIRQQQQFSMAMRQLVSELQTAPDREGLVFTGDRHGFISETASSLMPGLGSAPLATSVQFKSGDPSLTLRIEHPGEPATTYPWRLQLAEFRYADASGVLHDSWPAPSTTTPLSATPTGNGGPPKTIPSLIQLTLQFQDQARPMTLLMAPRASAWVLPEPTSPFGDLMPN